MKQIVRKHIKKTVHVFNIAFILFLAFSGSSLARDQKDENNEGIQQFMSQLESAAARIDSFHAFFIQEKELSLFAETMVFHGELLVVRPDKLRWEFISPVPSILILNGDIGMRCNAESTPTEFDLRTDPIMRSVAEQLWLWLGGDYSRLSDSFTLEKKGQNALFISPKERDISAFIESVTVTFNLANMQPQQVEIREPGGDLTRLRFSEYTYNVIPTDLMFSSCKTQRANDN